MPQIILLDPDQAILIHTLAHQIYYPTYSNILKADQLDFMLNHSYSEAAIVEAMANGQLFYVLFNDQAAPLGFMALQEKVSDPQTLRIEKLYLLPGVQGGGFGKQFIQFAVDNALKLGKDFVELNVNRANSAYNFYLKQGFVVTDTVDIPYYGYILDDYIMQKSCH